MGSRRRRSSDAVARVAGARYDSQVTLPLIGRIAAHGDRRAIVAGGREFTYRDLEGASSGVASRLLSDRDDLAEARVAFLIAPSFDYVATILGIWRAGGIAVPLAVSHP